MTSEVLRAIDVMPKEAWGILSLAIGLLAYFVYLRDTAVKKDVLPHPLSWFVWAFITAVATVVQCERGAGPGAWVTAFTAAGCIAIWFAALLKKRRLRRTNREFDAGSSWLEWSCFVLGLVAALWFGITKDATIAAILATIADLLGYQPTISKGWARPTSDSPRAFLLNSLKFVPACFALQSISIATALYPIAIIIANSGVWVMLRRRERFLCRAA